MSFSGSWNDTGLWATGQGWAAFGERYTPQLLVVVCLQPLLGMLRCQQTMVKSSLGHHFQSQSKDLLEWANELIHATWNFQVSKHYHSGEGLRS